MRATEGSVHIWRVDLAAAGDRPGELLSREELARAARIVPARKRVLWTRSRGVLRELLGRYLEHDPRALRFELDGGKPVLAHEAPAPSVDLRFNISHSGDLALVAVSEGREVGVDLERARERYTAEFLHDWVAREAVFKCRGDDPAPAAELWTAALDLGPRFAAAIAVEGSRCRLHSWEWRG